MLGAHFFSLANRVGESLYVELSYLLHFPFSWLSTHARELVREVRKNSVRFCSTTLLLFEITSGRRRSNARAISVVPCHSPRRACENRRTRCKYRVRIVRPSRSETPSSTWRVWALRLRGSAEGQPASAADRWRVTKMRTSTWRWERRARRCDDGSCVCTFVRGSREGSGPWRATVEGWGGLVVLFLLLTDSEAPLTAVLSVHMA